MGTTEIKENKDVVENAEVVEDTEAVEDVQEIKPYTLRNPKAADIATFLKLFSKLGIKDFKDSFSKDKIKQIIDAERDKEGGEVSNDEITKDSFIENVGIGLAFEIADIILERLSECQTEVFACLARLSGMKAEEVADLDMSVFTKMLYDAITLPGFADFIKVVSGLLGKNH